MMKSLLKFVFLPKDVSAVETRHINRINRVALGACLAHLPLFLLVAWLCQTSLLQALGFGCLLVLGPVVSTLVLRNPRMQSLVFGFTTMALGALLVHLGQGPMQIEMHFHFFAALALLTVWGNPSVIWVATITVALHHFLFWLFIPASVFNYAASIWVVLVHAIFVVVEAIAASFIARNFFDNVIGLEHIIEEKTQEVKQQHEDLKQIMDNTAQGFITISLDGRILSEPSTILTSWLGKVDVSSAFEFFGRINSEFGFRLRLVTEAIQEDMMPLEVSLDQFPRRLQVEGIALGIEYRPIMENGRVQKILLVISDLTSQLEKARNERIQQETIGIFEKVTHDSFGFLEFLEEGSRLVAQIVDVPASDPIQVSRYLHTLKGNSGLFGVHSIADLCHKIESEIEEHKEGLSPANGQELKHAWQDLQDRVSIFSVKEPRLQVSEGDLLDALAKIKRGASRDDIIKVLVSWRYEPIKSRFSRFAEQTRVIAERLEKLPVEIVTEDQGLRLPKENWSGFWAAFAHAIRNSVDHGLESPDQRKELGKASGWIRFSTQVRADGFSIIIEDNGAGIDWDRVRDKCRNKGLPHSNPDEMMAALFSDGFSTTDQANAFSGRGIGMGSLKVECARLGGTIALNSVRGQGTQLCFHFPLTAMLEPEEAQRAA